MKVSMSPGYGPTASIVVRFWTARECDDADSWHFPVRVSDPGSLCCLWVDLGTRSRLNLCTGWGNWPQGTMLDVWSCEDHHDLVVPWIPWARETASHTLLAACGPSPSGYVEWPGSECSIESQYPGIHYIVRHKFIILENVFVVTPLQISLLGVTIDWK
jgi:hypothetical protein